MKHNYLSVTISEKEIPPSFTAELLALKKGEALIIPTKKRGTAHGIIAYYRNVKGMKHLKYRSKKKTPTTCYFIRES